MKKLSYVPKTDYKIYTDSEKFSFTTDSVLLSDFAKMKKRESLIDLGCGTGILMLSCKGLYNLGHVIGIEIQEDVFKLCKESMKVNNISDYTLINKSFKDVDIKSDSIDNIIVNPPYQVIGHGEENKRENFTKSRYDLTMNLEDIFKFSARVLKSNKSLFMINKPERLVDIFFYARKNRLEPKRIRFVQPFKDKAPKLVMIEFIKNQRPFLKYEANLIIHGEKDYTEEVMRIYGRI
ncbi:MAG: methyltransferase [Finegoldia sp.]|nr:methyltransferase [Finegoldia sp.]